MTLILSNGKLDRIATSTRTITLTAKTVNDWDTSGSSVIMCNLDTAAITTYLSVTGMVAGVDGEIRIIIPTHSSKFINFYHENASSAASNRLFLPGNGNFQMSARGAVIFMYLTSTSRWHVIGETGTSGIGVISASIGAVGSGGP